GFKSIWIIPYGKQTAEKVTSQLMSLPDFQFVDVVAFGNPVTDGECTNIRKLFGNLKWKSHNVTNEELGQFLQSIVSNTFGFYIDTGEYQRKKVRDGDTVEFSIRPIEEHPDYDEELFLKKRKEREQEREETEEDLNRHYSTDDFITIKDVTIEEIEEPEPPLPPGV